jgi:hypothetical protein
MKKTAKKLELSKETLRRLNDAALGDVIAAAAPASHEASCADSACAGGC